MRILAIDVGTGTQDILLFDSAQTTENCVKMVMPSPTARIALRIEASTARLQPVLLTGTTMGGGPCQWAAERHLKAGLPVYATPGAALTFDDHLENVARLGVTLVSEDEAKALQDAERIVMGDLDLEAVARALDAYGVDPHYDAVAAAVFDHGAAPIDVSDRVFRFDHLRRTVERQNTLAAFGYFAQEVPPYLTRMQALADHFPLDVPLLLLDTAPAGAMGALDDPEVARHRHRLIVNLGNMHATAFRLEGDAIQGLFEHHTGLVERKKLEGLLRKLMEGTLSNEEVFNDHGHGAHILHHQWEEPFLAITGPQRASMAQSVLGPYFAAPHGDMMLSGCFGLVRCFAHKMPHWREEIEAALAAAPSVRHEHTH